MAFPPKFNRPALDSEPDDQDQPASMSQVFGQSEEDDNADAGEPAGADEAPATGPRYSAAQFAAPLQDRFDPRQFSNPNSARLFEPQSQQLNIEDRQALRRGAGIASQLNQQQRAT